MTVAQAQQNIDAREFAEWMAFDSIDPIGELRADLRAAHLLHAITSMFAGKGHNARATDYLICELDRPKREVGAALANNDWFHRAQMRARQQAQAAKAANAAKVKVNGDSR